MKSFKGWQQIAATMLMQAASSGSIFISYSVIAGPLQQSFAPSRTLLMMAITAVLIGSGVLSPLLGRTMERVSLKRLMIVGASSLGLGFIALSQSQSMPQVLLVYLIAMSLSSVLCGPIAGSALLARWFNKRRGLAMSLSAAGAAVGGLIAPPLLQFLIEQFSWRTALFGYGLGLLALLIPMLTLLIIDRPEQVSQFPDGADSAPEQNAQQTAQPGLGFYLGDRNFWLIAIILGLLFASSMGITANLLQYVAEQGMDAASGAVLLSIFAGANFVGKLGSGVAADKFNPRALLAGIIIVFGSAVLCFAQLPIYGVFVAASALLGVSQGAIVPLWSVMMARFYGPDRVGSSMGMMSLLLTPFNLVAAPAFGYVFDSTGSYVNAYMTCAALMLLGLALVSLIRESK